VWLVDSSDAMLCEVMTRGLAERCRAAVPNCSPAAMEVDTYSACDPFWLQVVNVEDVSMMVVEQQVGRWLEICCVVGQKDSKQSALDQHEARSTSVP
jgi:hypothetical protein